MCCNTGWTWDYVWNNLTVEMWVALEDRWSAHPPVNELLAVFMGYESPEKETKAADATPAVLAQFFPGGAINA